MVIGYWPVYCQMPHNLSVHNGLEYLYSIFVGYLTDKHDHFNYLMLVSQTTLI